MNVKWAVCKYEYIKIQRSFERNSLFVQLWIYTLYTTTNNCEISKKYRCRPVIIFYPLRLCHAYYFTPSVYRMAVKSTTTKVIERNPIKIAGFIFLFIDDNSIVCIRMKMLAKGSPKKRKEHRLLHKPCAADSYIQ